MTEVLPCPFCKAGETCIQVNYLNRGLHMGKTENPVISAEVRHWCEPITGQPNRLSITMVGRDEADAVSRWNTRSAPVDVPELAEETALDAFHAIGILSYAYKHIAAAAKIIASAIRKGRGEVA